ncbi:MAG: outer membrane protein transport protein [Verrucomicrobia bacterium]|nr:outer membrane protein transport protein [Verrucomicrobiota bacterium]
MTTRQLRLGPWGAWGRTAAGLTLGLAVLLRPAPALGVGYRLPNQDPDAIARGNAFVATADDPSAIYYNPAGITQLQGQNAQVGLYLIDVGISYDSPTGAHVDNQSSIQPVPQLNYVYSPPDCPLAFGLGIYVPYGLSVDYPADSPLRTAAISGSLLYTTLNPVIAWRITPKLSVALGPTINLSEIQFERGLGLTPGDQFKYKGEGWDAGFNAGIRWQPVERWAFGAQYHSATTVDYHGHSEIYPYAPPPYYPRTSTGAQIRFPQFAVGGVSFRPTPDWNLEFDVDWTDWHSVREIPFSGVPLPAFPIDGLSSLMYEFGVTRQLSRGYYCSAGYFYSEKSGPDSTFNPVIPDANLHLGGLGFGHHGRRWDWSVGYQFAVGQRLVANDTANPAANGTYHIFNNAVNLSVRLRF